MSRDRNFFAELKRRNIYKVAAAYIFAAWALSQGLAQLLPVFDVPNWTVRLLILLLVLGFPVVLMFAWAFELTPEGVRRTEQVDPKKSIRHSTGRKLVAISIALAALATALFIFHLSGRDRSARGADDTAVEPGGSSVTPLPISDKSVAVLPFDSLSEDKAKLISRTASRTKS